MAQIRKRKNSYQIIVVNGEDVNGKRIEKTMTYHPDPKLTPKQLEKALQKVAMEFEDKVKNGNCLDGDKLTLSDFYDKWKQEYGEIELEKTTLAVYDHNFKSKVIPVLGNMKLSTIKPLHLNSLYNSLRKDGARMDGKKGGYSPTTINKVHAILSSILSQAVAWDIILYNPCDRVKTPRKAKDNDDIEYFTIEQTQCFLKALDKEYDQPVKQRQRKDSNGNTYNVAPYTAKVKIPLQFKVLYYIAIYGGLRRGELIALQWNDINFETNSITISKSTAYLPGESYIKGTKNKTSNRSITLPLSVMKLLSQYKKEYQQKQLEIGSKWAVDENGKRLNYIFIQSTGKQMNISTPLQRFHSIINLYNETVEKESDKLPLIHFHGLRHTSASLLISQGVDIRTVAGRLGHAQTSTTLDIYSHPLKEMDEIASEKLENLLVKKNII